MTQPARGWTVAQIVLSIPDSNHGPTTHTSCHKTIKKNQIAIRSSHTHWVHLKFTQIAQKLLTPDWR